MAALVSVLIAVILSLLVTRVAAEALTLTGLSHASASFQARSAFTGAGFTTAESESVVEHPVRRRIIMLLMFLGNAGVVTVISSLVLTFVATSPENRAIRLLYLLLGIVVLWIVASNSAFNRLLTRVVRRALHRWTDLNLHDYDKLLHLRGEYQVIKLKVDDYNDWLADKKFKELRLRDEGITVLGIDRCNGNYIGIPHGNTHICHGDTLIVYGCKGTLLELDARRDDYRGQQAHQESVVNHKQAKAEQDRQDEVLRGEQN